jgi:hypothetical protein
MWTNHITLRRFNLDHLHSPDNENINMAAMQTSQTGTLVSFNTQEFSVSYDTQSS